MMTGTLTQAQLLDKALNESRGYCLTRYLLNCVWEAGFKISSAMCRITMFFAIAEHYKKHGVLVIDEPFQKWLNGPMLPSFDAATRNWGENYTEIHNRLDGAFILGAGLVVPDENHKYKFQWLEYPLVAKYFDKNYPELRSIFVRITQVLDKMNDQEIQSFMRFVGEKSFEKQGRDYCYRKYNSGDPVLITEAELLHFATFEECLLESSEITT